MEPKKTPPADAAKAIFPPSTLNKSFKVISNNQSESFFTIARDLGIVAWDLIEFNFPGSKNRPDVVNWYLYHKMGCRQATRDGNNYMFDVGMKIYHPSAAAPPAQAIEPPAKHPFRKGWTHASIAEYHDFVLKQGVSYANSFLMQFDCANFALHLLLEFAKCHYLPVAFQYVNGMILADFESILSFPSFMDDVKKKVGARDLRSGYSHAETLPGYLHLKAGDILVGTASNHVMVFYRSGSLIHVSGVPGNRPVMEILQGNLESIDFIVYKRAFSTRVQYNAYDLNNNDGYVNHGNGWEKRKHASTYAQIQAQFQPRRWNFSWFNQVHGFPPL